MSADHEAYSVVIPTVGRSCLADCLGALARSEGPAPDEVVLVDDRPERESDPAPLPLAVLGSLRDRTTVVRTGGRGPAAARNIGWRMVSTPWVAFLDDDVRVSADWRERLAEDLAACPVEAAGTEADLVVPLPEDRRPTDWERNTAGLADARWVTADLAYRTDALKAVNGFDERFLRAFREDADLALRLQDAGWRITTGTRRTEHPVREAGAWVSVRAQRGNADDALMLRLHGPSWWQRASAPRGR
ncbi:glycosyltransferase family 2 protein, partial [Streptomyces sparsus]